MRIFVISDLPQFVTGGAETQASRLIEAWLDAGHQVICVGRRMGPDPVQIGTHVLQVHRIRTTSLFGRLGRAASYFFSLCWLLLRYRKQVDVVYTRFLGDAAITAATLKRFGLLRVPLVATPASVGGNDDIHFLRSIPFHGRVIRLLDQQCGAINLIAGDMADELCSAGFSGHNFSHITNGIRLAPPARHTASSTPIFLAVGRLSAEKGYDVLLQAVALIKPQLQSRQIRIAGDGPERERLAGLAEELHVEGKIEWLGELTPAQVDEQLALANVFLLPSRHEGLSNAGLEAMERGLAIILTRCGGLDRHVSADMGWVVPPGDPAALAQAISMALATPPNHLSAMGESARGCIERNFDIEVIAGRYIELFEQLCKPPAQARSTYEA